ncbi:MAG: hypothetical protein ACRCSL_04800 [Microbacterium sp.]
MSDLGEYLSEFGAATPSSGLVVGPATGLSPQQSLVITTPPVSETAAARRRVDTEMWTLDARWLPAAKYIDTSMCARQPDMGGPVVIDTTDAYYANNRVCTNWDGYNNPPSCTTTYWALPCSDEMRVKYAFQYQRYVWAQQRLRELLLRKPDLTALGAASDAARTAGALATADWCAQVAGLMTAAVVSTNVLFGAEDGYRWVNEGFFPGETPWEATRNPSYRPRVLLPRVVTHPGDNPDVAGYVYVRAPMPSLTGYSSVSWAPHPSGLTHGAKTLFPVVRVAVSERQFVVYPGLGAPRRPDALNVAPREAVGAAGYDLLVSKYGAGTYEPAGSLRWIKATIGRGAWIRETLPDGKIAFVQGIDGYVEGLRIYAETLLEKSFFDWIGAALELYADRLTVFYNRMPAGSIQLDQAELLRNVRESIEATRVMRSQEAGYGNAGFNAISGLLIMGVSAVSGAAGAVVALVLAALQAGLSALAQAFGTDVRAGFGCPYPPFVRVLPENCDMPMTEAAVRNLFPQARWTTPPAQLVALMRNLDASTRAVTREAIRRGVTTPCPPGTTGTPPNCRPVQKASGGGLVIGAAALLLLSRFLR